MRIKLFIIGVLFNFLFIPGLCRGDESDIFTVSAQPDVLILLDLSESMNLNPEGNYCYTRNCTRLAMAKAAIREILDANKDGQINSQDEQTLATRVGYMRFYNCTIDDTAGSYNTGCISLQNPIPNADSSPFPSPSSYAEIWSNVNAERAGGSTPAASALNEARLYLDFHKNHDSGAACRNKYVILVTDGQDTLACDGRGIPNQNDNYKRRKAVVAKAKALSDAGYKVFVIGFGANMPTELQNTLNWAAYFGGTEDLSASKSGDTNAILPSADPCGEGTINDPGTAALSGYAFLATDASEITEALRRVFVNLFNSRFSFAAPSVAASRVTSENFLYEASFKPSSLDAFWEGHLKKYSINLDGSIGGTLWDSGSLLQSRDSSSRQIFTYLSGTTVPFMPGTFTSPATLNVQTSQDVDAVVGFIRGDSSNNSAVWKLGDIFHSNPITIRAPSYFYSDIRSPEAFEDFRDSHSARERLVLAGANDGQFHAFRGDDGSEKWSFIPPNLLPKLQYILPSVYKNKPQHINFVDGPVSGADVWLGSGDGRNKYAGDWHTLLVFGEGRGVRNLDGDADFLWSASPFCDSGFQKDFDSAHSNYCGFYALDVTDTSASQPVFKWILNFPSSGPQTQSFLGEPWSQMAIGKVLIGGNEKWIGMIGGGYSKEGDKGKGVFVIDLKTGAVLWSFAKGSSDTGTTSSKMDYPIAASPAIVDLDNDGFIDTAYVGDLGGNIWRFGFCMQAEGNTCTPNNWNGSLFFQPSSGFNQPVYTRVAVAKTPSLWVFWGTGDRENPTATGFVDHFLALQDPDRSATYTINQLQNIPTEGKVYNGSKMGWYLSLNQGEKILSDPTVFGGAALFTTYVPSISSSDPCNRTGTSKLYAMAIMPLAIGAYRYDTGAGLLSTPLSTDITTGGARSVTLSAGIVTSPIISQKPYPGGATDLYFSLGGGGSQGIQTVSSTKLGSMPLNELLEQTGPSSYIAHWYDRRLK